MEMNELASQKVLAIPEILGIILRFLDPEILKTASLVSRTWYQHTIQIPWRQLVIPKDWYSLDLSSLWPVLDRRGSLLRALVLELSPATRVLPELDEPQIRTQLENLLSRCPRLEHLHIQVPGEIPSKVITSTIAATHHQRLKHLETNILNWDPKDLTQLLKDCPTLRQLAGHNFTGHVLRAIAESQPNLDMIDCTHPRFDDDELVEFAKALPNLRQLSVTVHQFLTAKALIGVSEHCLYLEHLKFHFCLGLQSSGFQALLRVSPNLRTLDLGLTEVRDADISLVAGHCPRLESLKLPFCSNITKASIGEIVQSCRRLVHLDLSFCDGLLLSVFEDPVNRPWVCDQLQYLDISGIHASYSVEASLASSLLPNMYHQISLLKRLESLRMTAHGFSLKLLEVGKPFLAQLKDLETLDLTKVKHPLLWQDMIEIGNLFPKLKKLEFRSSDIIPPLSKTEQKAILKAMEDHAGVRPLFSEYQGIPLLGGKKRKSRDDDENPPGDQEIAITETGAETANTEDESGPKTAKRRRSQSPQAAATLTGFEAPSTTTMTGDDDEDNEPLPEVMTATLRSGLQISFRLNGEDEQEGGEEEGWGFPGGMHTFGI
ncbi:hypothetical protein BGZ83_006301 [Gryganskiella cystojenkinii]|nr:hypothetical protein BGZ83_006301 [Gryganskiella cystojenkinii]